MTRVIKFRAWDVKNKARNKFYTNVGCMRHLGNDNLAVTKLAEGLK
jgi:uncharacterized radical SAM superfamily protein